MSKVKILYYEGLGEIQVTQNIRARRFIFRVRNNQLQMTAPKYSSEKEMIEAIGKMFDKLKGLLDKAQEPIIDLDFKIESHYFKFSIVEGKDDKFLACSELGELVVIAPPNTNFHDDALQAWLKKVIIEALRRNAKIILPPKLYMLSNKYSIPYNKLSINTSVGRWGSCSSKQNINLSAYLMLLPEHLIDYVLLHELTHINEMNHSDKFWSRLDMLTDGQAKALDKELKNYTTSVFPSKQN